MEIKVHGHLYIVLNIFTSIPNILIYHCHILYMPSSINDALTQAEFGPEIHHWF